jgi:hypothetical protein
MFALFSFVLFAATTGATLLAQAPEPASAPDRERLLVCNKAERTLSNFAPGERSER